MTSPILRLLQAALLLLSGGLYVARADLAPTEADIVRHAAAGQSAAEALLARVVDIESPTENLAGVRAVGEAFAEELQAIGFRTRLVRYPEKQFTIIILANRSDTKLDEFPHRIADLVLFEGRE